MREYYDNCCSLPEIVTLAGKKMNVDELINLLRSGKLDGKIYDDTYFNTADQLKEAVAGAFPDAEWSDSQNTLWAKLTHNIYTFSGAKNYNELLAYRAAMMDDEGNLVSYEKFRQRVTRIGEEFNDHYLRAEYNSAARFAEMADKWDYLKKFDVLEYRTVQDDRVRESHKQLHGKRFKTDDPIWDVIYPPNDWGCRCTVIPAQGKPTDNPASVSSYTNEEIIKPYFRRNIGKQEIIFANDHPFMKSAGKIVSDMSATDHYGMYTIDRIYRDLQNLPIVTPISNPAAARNWVDAQKVFTGADKLTIVIDAAFAEKALNNYDYIHVSKSVVEKPDEIWSTMRKGNLKQTYIKYFRDAAYVFTVIEKAGKMIFESFFKTTSKSEMDKLRHGVLKHRK